MARDFYAIGRKMGLKWATEYGHHEDLEEKSDLIRDMGCDHQYRRGFLDAALEVLMSEPSSVLI
jgi:hypothetical protein